MKTSGLVAVIIPIYKEDLNKDEIISLTQCIRILKKHPIVFIGPVNLNTTAYDQICKIHFPFRFIAFDKLYFGGIEGYNKLMLSIGFYKEFLCYKYILIHQLDCYVFSDQLVYWCNKNYDFIGAPHPAHGNRPGEMQFLKGYSKVIKIINLLFRTDHKISNVGNGGFSLRKTRSFYLLLRLLKRKISLWGANNEDGFFKYWGNLLFPLFKLPSDETALHFAIEQFPAESLKKLNNTLPFGCHAFRKYEPEVWKQFIEEL